AANAATPPPEMPSASPDAQDLPASANKETPQQPDQTPTTTDSVHTAAQSATGMEIDELAPLSLARPLRPRTA
ncbi:hypothetical protein SEPCBS119000_006755, partial [Sporothrix epigloea]